MQAKVKAVPPGYHTITPGLIIKGAAEAIDFYKKAFGAIEVYRFLGPGGSVIHAELKIGDSMLFVNDPFPNSGGRAPTNPNEATANLHLYVEDVDAAFQRAVDAGASPVMPPMDMFWGDRMARVCDPFNHWWAFATHIEDVTPEEMTRRSQEFFAKMTQK